MEPVEEKNKFRNIIQFKKNNPISGLIDVDNLYLDFSEENQNICFIQNYAKQILHNNIWYTAIRLQSHDTNIRDLVYDNYPEIAHHFQKFDPLSINDQPNTTDENGTITSSWLKINEHVIAQLLVIPVH
ncbi:hypothetical protein [Ligilactobacillus cholophilus]|uniref:hypothetical protein n=1 Tax=Ligilactobacillus cholophilus TaxID=3050131 RepID=UPI0025B07774|nr:hypothetical protein [Ligilactobacillus cholophilus]